MKIRGFKKLISSFQRVEHHVAAFGRSTFKNRWEFKGERQRAREEKELEKIDVEVEPVNPISTRFARVKNAGKGKYHVVGMGVVNAANFSELKSVCKGNGYTDIKMGAIKAKL